MTRGTRVDCTRGPGQPLRPDWRKQKCGVASVRDRCEPGPRLTHRSARPSTVRRARGAPRMRGGPWGSDRQGEETALL
eukprot:5644525-Alexandrium_andersonii.AAC.1